MGEMFVLRVRKGFLFSKARGSKETIVQDIIVVVLDPYNTSDYPITIVVASLINIVVPLLSPYCYYCASQNPSIVILVALYYYCQVDWVIL